MNNRIRKIRVSNSLTQSEFAEKINLQRNSITLIETGKRNPSNRTINDICSVFNINEEWLRTGVGEMYLKTSINMSIGGRIKSVRKDFNFTQMNFGAKVGVKGNTITNYEIGLRNPSEAVIFSICREFNVNEEWLRTGVGEIYKKTPSTVLDQLANEFNLNELEYVFLNDYLKLNIRTRETVSNFLLNTLLHYIQPIQDAEEAYKKT